MRKHGNRGWHRALVAACIAGGIGLGGTAAAQHRGNWHAGRGHTSVQSGATLYLNGERIGLAGRSIVYELAEALRCRGYAVSIHDGCITVGYRGNAPRVSLTGCDYDILVERSRGRLSIRPYLIHARSHVHFDRGHYDRGRNDRGHYDRGRGHGHSHGRRGYSRWPSYPSSGWTIRIGTSSHCR